MLDHELKIVIGLVELIPEEKVRLAKNVSLSRVYLKFVHGPETAESL
jgi:hypothetical protein